jgi:hypothetical protein
MTLSVADWLLDPAILKSLLLLLKEARTFSVGIGLGLLAVAPSVGFRRNCSSHCRTL